MKQRFYVGCRVLDAVYEVFKAAEPTESSHGHLYSFVIGDFRTKRGAKFMARYGRGNPHCNTVDQVEKLAKILQNSEKK